MPLWTDAARFAAGMEQGSQADGGRNALRSEPIPPVLIHIRRAVEKRRGGIPDSVTHRPSIIIFLFIPFL